MQSQQLLKDKKILFATTPAAGHFNPLTGLAKYLKEAGNDVRWYTTSDFEENISEMAIPHYPFKKALNVNFNNLDAFFPERATLKSPVAKMNFDMINLFGNRAKEYFADMQEIFKSFPYDLVICDNTFSVVPLIKEVLHIPVVVVGVMPLAETSGELGPYGLGILPASNFASRFKNRIMRFMLTNVLAKKSIRSFAAILKPYHITGTNTTLLNLLVKKADLLLQIGTQSFEYERSDLGRNVRFIGALPAVAKKQTAEKWYDERLQRYTTIILVTQGTVEKNLENLIIPTIEAFKGTENLVIVTTGSNQTRELRLKYNYDNIIIEDFIDYDDIMPHVSVYVTNGGYGGVIQSLKYKLPIVAAGVFEGKSETCAHIGFFNYGIDLKTETPSAAVVQKAVEEVLNNPVYSTNVNRLSQEFANINSEELCAMHISRVLDARRRKK